MFGRGVSRRTARRTSRRMMRRSIVGLLIGGVALMALGSYVFTARQRKMSEMHEGGSQEY